MSRKFEGRQKRFVSLNIKVFFLAIAVALVPSLIMGTVIYRRSIRIVTEKQENAVRNSFQSMSDKINIFLEYAHSTSLSVIGNNTVRRAFIKENPSQSEMLLWNNSILSDLKYFIGQNSYMDGICITGLNGVVIELGNVDKRLIEDNLEEISEAHGKAVWKWKEGKGGLHLYLLREIRDTENPSEVLGYQEIAISGDGVKESFQEFLEVYPGQIALRNTTGKDIFAVGEADLFDAKYESEKNTEDFGWYNKNGIITYYCNIENTGWQIVSNMLEREIFADNLTIRSIFILMIVISLCLGLLIVWIFSRLIVYPIRKLTEETVKISNNDYNIQTDTKRNDEIGVLSTRFQDMAKKLDELINEVLRGKVLQQEAQYRALQAQINPHFLYNNLDTAYWMSRMEKAEKTGKILLALSALYRSVTNTKVRFTTVETEVKSAKDYIIIQEMRLGNLIDFEVIVEESVGKMATLRFLLQPLIENSIEHGILPTGRKGKIKLRIFRNDKILFFEIEDSGYLVKAEEITKLLLQEEKPNDKKGIAIRNINQRIQIQYGSEYGLTFENIAEGGIRTVVTQPVRPYIPETGTGN